MVAAAAEQAAAQGAIPTSELPAYVVEKTRDRAHGDLAANFAMQAARSMKLPPRAVAQAVVDRLSLADSLVEKAEVAGPGFVNFTLSPAFYAGALMGIEKAGHAFGESEGGRGKRVQVEFVSANPTGPMHMGNARGGVLGDSLSSVLEKCGYEVTREFYVNDAGNQVDLLGRSLEVRYIQHLKGEQAMEFPEDGYHGEDVKVIAREFAALHGNSFLDKPEEERRAALVRYGLDHNIEKMQADLARYRIKYDNWFFESSLHKSGYVEDTIRKLDEAGWLYEKDGALWFKASELGCEKDEVLRKSNGFFTYYAVDIAYHRNKFIERGFDIVIDALGADHHGHTQRFKAGMAAIGVEPERLQFMLFQLVRLVQGGEVVRMSKRTGKTISLSDLLDEVPVDAARFFFNSRQPDTHLEFDLDLAVRQDSENPVYYVQYAHARIASILRLLKEDGIDLPRAVETDLSKLAEPEERELIKQLAGLPDELITAARTLDPSRVVRYCVDTATLFHKFYNACRVRCEDIELMKARLVLCSATRTVIRNVLELLKIEAPDRM